jgi:hypothetical protein
MIFFLLIHHLVLGRGKESEHLHKLSHFRVFGRYYETSRFSKLNNITETRRVVRFTVMPASHSLRYSCPAHEVTGSSEVLNWFQTLLCGVKLRGKHRVVSDITTWTRFNNDHSSRGHARVAFGANDTAITLACVATQIRGVAMW